MCEKLIEHENILSNFSVIEQNGEHVVIDDISLGLIEGAKVDYIDELAR